MQAGTVLSQRYRIVDKLGEGGMGVVFKAHDTLLERTVAIKTLTPLLGNGGARRFLREAQSVARLNHPHIVSIYDAVEEGGTFAIVMELIEGKTLREILPLPLDRLIDIATQVLEALEYAHGQGIVHRDIKPENIVITSDGVAKLMDFGLARSEGRSRLTQTGMVVGTVPYLAPEQALGGQVDGRSDLYSLGAVLYEAVAGRPPFESDDPISVITQHINVPPVAPHWHNPAVPQSLERVILKLLAKDPSRRYQSAKEVLSAISTVSVGQAQLTEQDKIVGPGLVEQVPHSPLVGRDAELTRLKELVDRMISGQGGIVLLTGPLGVGKTRLVEEVSTFARLRGASVVSGKAYESAPPYEPIAKALRDLARGVDSETLAARLGQFAAEVVELIPELKAQLPRISELARGSADDRRHRLFAGVAHFLTATATSNPVLLFLDDMHLSDAASTELLQHIARRTETSRMLLIAAYRPDDIPTTPAGDEFNQVAHALSREMFCTHIPLRPLTEEQVTDLIKLMANHPSRPVRFGRRIFEATEGNPYFIEEVIKGLFEQGRLYIKDGQWSTDFDDIKDYSLLEIPTSAHSAVKVRLRTLDDQTKQVLTLAAVIGRQFSFDTLLEVAGIEETSLLDRIEDAMRVQIVREVRGAGEDVYEFAQPMLRQTLYDSIPRRRRRMLHRQVGGSLEKLYGRKLEPHFEALTFHFSEAEDAEKTLHYARLAADKAAALFAYDDAASYLQEAITAADELGNPEMQLELTEKLGDLLLTGGKREKAVPTYEDAVRFWKSLPGASKMDGVRLYRKLGELARWAVYNPRSLEHIAEGLRLVEDAPEHPERVKLIIARAFSHFHLRPEVECDYPAAEESALEGYRLAEKIDAPQEMSAALDALAGMYQHTADFPKMLSATRRREPIVARLDDPVEHIDLHRMLGFAYEHLGNYPEALKQMGQGFELASRSGKAHHLLYTIPYMARINLAWNRWEEVERWYRIYNETENRIAIRHPQRRVAIGSRAVAAAIQGNLEDARRQLDELQASPVHPGAAWGKPFWTAYAILTIGDYEQCRPELDEGLRLADRPLARLELHTLALQFASQAQIWSYIDDLGNETLERARRSGAQPHIALACRALGAHRREHEQPDESEKLLNEAEEIFRALDCPWELARTLRELALLRRIQGRKGDAAQLLQEALSHFDALSTVPDAELTRALM